MSKKIFSIIVILVFVFSGFSLTAEEKTVSKKALRLQKKADKAFEAKEYDKAFEMYQQVAQMEPAHAPAYLKMGIILNGQKKFDEALVNLDKALDLQPDFPEAVNAIIPTLYALARPKMAQKDLKGANDLYERIVGFKVTDESLKGVQIQVMYQVGLNYYNLKEFAKSSDYFFKFMKIPGVDTAYNNLVIVANYMIGVNSYQLKNLDQAVQYLGKFIELNKDGTANRQLLPLAHYMIGSAGFDMLEKEIGKKESTDIEGVAKLAKADKLIAPNLTKAIELRPDLEFAYMTLGNYYYYCRDIDNAVKTYKALIEKFPTSPDLKAYRDFLKQLEESKK